MINDIVYISNYYSLPYYKCKLENNVYWIAFRQKNCYINIISEDWFNDVKWYSDDFGNTLLDGLIFYFTKTTEMKYYLSELKEFIVESNQHEEL